MKSIYAKYVASMFSKSMREKFPMFRELEDKATKENKGVNNKLYLWRYAEKLNFYIILIFSSEKMEESFSIECAFSESQKLSCFKSLMYPLGVPESNIEPSIPTNGVMYFRMGYLFEKPRDYWWRIVPIITHKELNKPCKISQEDGNVLPDIYKKETIDIISNLVEDAILKIKNYTIPYFEKIIVQYNKSSGFWERYKSCDIKKEMRERLLKEYGGTIDKECCVISCENKRLKKVAYCLDHLLEELKNKVAKS